MSNQLRNNLVTPKFPVNLLIAGYGTAGLVALAMNLLLGVGILAVGLTLWLGGAIAVFFWGGVWAYFRKTIGARPKRPAAFPAAPRVAVPVK